MTAKKKHSGLDADTLDKIRNELLSRREQLKNDLNDLAGSSQDNDEQKVKFPDFGDKSDENAQEIGEYSTNLATEKVLESTLRDTENTLKRIEDGTYGFCKYCKKEINSKRLLARPVASACVACKTKLQNSV